MMYDELTKLAVALLIGSLLGLEREYHNKPAGFRTIALICVGAAMFTLLSINLGGLSNSSDRIASNIITGIGFIGAGVIFKIGNNVSGLTTAATIWIASALGMATGAGHFTLAWTGLAMVLLILTVFERIQERLHLFHQQRIYLLVAETYSVMLTVEAEMSRQHLSFQRLKEKRSSEGQICQYEVTGHNPNLLLLDEFLRTNEAIKSFEY